MQGLLQRQGLDRRSLVPQHIDDAVGRQALHGFAHGIAAHAELRGQIHFHQTLAWHKALDFQAMDDAVENFIGRTERGFGAGGQRLCGRGGEGVRGHVGRYSRRGAASVHSVFGHRGVSAAVFVFNIILQCCSVI
ncbi:hypothetical protein D3C71_1834440 [compost metagenome]